MIAVSLAVLCAEATVNDRGFLTLREIGGSLFYAQEAPALMPMDLGLIFTADGADIGKKGNIKVEFIDVDGHGFGDFTFLWRVERPSNYVPGFPLWQHFACSLREFLIPRFGTYRIDISVDGAVKHQLNFIMSRP
jgi:hypothetical protein